MNPHHTFRKPQTTNHDSLEKRIPVPFARGATLLSALALLAAAPGASAQGQFSWANMGTGDSDALVGLNPNKTYLENSDLHPANRPRHHKEILPPHGHPVER